LDVSLSLLLAPLFPYIDLLSRSEVRNPRRVRWYDPAGNSV